MKQKGQQPSVIRNEPRRSQRQRTQNAKDGSEDRKEHEGLMAGIGGWTGSLTKKDTWLAPAAGTARSRPIEDLVGWLNVNATTKRGERLQALIRDLKQVESLSEGVRAAEPRYLAPRRSIRGEDPKSMKAMALAHGRIQSACKRFCLYPRLTWSCEQRDWSLSFFTTGEIGELPVVYHGPGDQGRRVFEADAAIVVIGIAQRGDIGRLRACAQCGTWFFASANTSHNARRFCNDSCRLKNFHGRRRR
jgi:hypothetical protein